MTRSKQSREALPRSPGVGLDNADTVYQFDTDPALSPDEQALNDVGSILCLPEPELRSPFDDLHLVVEVVPNDLGEAEITLSKPYAITPAIKGAIKSLPGVVLVEDI